MSDPAPDPAILALAALIGEQLAREALAAAAAAESQSQAPEEPTPAE